MNGHVYIEDCLHFRARLQNSPVQVQSTSGRFLQRARRRRRHSGKSPRIHDYQTKATGINVILQLHVESFVFAAVSAPFLSIERWEGEGGKEGEPESQSRSHTFAAVILKSYNHTAVE